MLTIKDLIKDKDYDFISLRLAVTEADDIFFGTAKSENGELIALDGDTYSEDTKVLEYEEWDNPEENIKNGLTVVITFEREE